MKEVLAVIRPNRMGTTKEVLAAAGFPSLTAWRVLGRGKQKGLSGEVAALPGPPPEAPPLGGGMEFVPKRLLYLVVPDQDVEQVVNLILAVNKTGHVGDGRVFVCPLEDAVRVRTGQQGEEALT